MEHVEVLDWLSMRTDVDDFFVYQIPFLYVVVCASNQYSDLVDAPDSSKDRGTTSGPLNYYLSLNLVSRGRKLCLIDYHIAIPKASKEERSTEVGLRDWSEFQNRY